MGRTVGNRTPAEYTFQSKETKRRARGSGARHALTSSQPAMMEVCVCFFERQGGVVLLRRGLHGAEKEQDNHRRGDAGRQAGVG